MSAAVEAVDGAMRCLARWERICFFRRYAAGRMALMSEGMVVRASRRTLPGVAVEESNLMVEMAVERRTSRSLG